MALYLLNTLHIKMNQTMSLAEECVLNPMDDFQILEYLAENNDPNASLCFGLACLQEPMNIPSAISHLTKASLAGIDEATEYLSSIYGGVYGEEHQNSISYFLCIQRLSVKYSDQKNKQGAMATLTLGNCYLVGFGTPKSVAHAYLSLADARERGISVIEILDVIQFAYDRKLIIHCEYKILKEYFESGDC